MAFLLSILLYGRGGRGSYVWIGKEEKGSEGRGMNDGQKLKDARVRGERKPWESKHQHPRYGSQGGLFPVVLSLSHLILYAYTYTYYLRPA